MIRNHALKELVSTEKSFIRNMRKLSDNHFGPMKAAIDNDTVNITEEDKALFDLYCKEIASLIADFDRLGLENISDPVALLEILQSEDYKTYINTLTSLGLKYSEFNKLTERVNYTPNNESISDYTSQPFQRVMRYKMIISEAIKLNRKEIEKQNAKLLDESSSPEEKAEANEILQDCNKLTANNLINNVGNLMGMFAIEFNKAKGYADGRQMGLKDLQALKNATNTSRFNKKNAISIETKALKLLINRKPQTNEGAKAESNAYISTILCSAFSDKFIISNGELYLVDNSQIQDNPIDLNNLESLKRLGLENPLIFKIIIATNDVPDCDPNMKIEAISQIFNLLLDGQFGQTNKQSIARHLLTLAERIDSESIITQELQNEIQKIERPFSSSLRTYSGTLFGSKDSSSRSSSPTSSIDSFLSARTSHEGSSSDDSIDKSRSSSTGSIESSDSDIEPDSPKLK